MGATSARTLAVGTLTAGSAYYAWKNNTQIQMPSLMRLANIAECANENSAYKVPSRDYCDEVKAELMKFCSQRRNMAPLFVRLSWHDCGTFDAKDGSGGPRACMRHAGGEAEHGANAGLAIARNMLAPIKQKFPEISNADFWALTAVCAIKVMGGPDVKWRPGRADGVKGSDVPDGRLPDATQGC